MLVDMFCNIKNKFNCMKINYQIQFLVCVCVMSNKERKQIVRKHISSTTKAALLRKRKQVYQSVDPNENDLFKYAEKISK